MDSFAEMLPLMFMMVIPIIAIVGGITHGIIKSVHRQRLRELAHRERIAAIERGINPEDIPAGPTGADFADTEDSNGRYLEHRQLLRSQRFKLWGMIAIGVGIATAFGIHNAPDSDPGAVFAGFGIAFVGVALYLAGRMVRPDPEDLRREKELRERLLRKSIGEAPGREQGA
jgi:hypothetical protein